MEKAFAYGLCRSPIGWFGLAAGNGSLLEIFSAPEVSEVLERIARRYPEARADDTEVIADTIRQLDDYFHGRRRNFDLPLAMDTLTPFTARVLRTLAAVPYGSTLTYGELAALAGFPRAARAVGRTMAVNPFPIVISCHRVLGAGGSMTGYSGGEGIATKQWLLRLEDENR